jgi:hypothetical protein
MKSRRQAIAIGLSEARRRRQNPQEKGSREKEERRQIHRQAQIQR